MTFSTNVPNSSQSPGIFPAQNNTNFTRIKAIFDADHNWLDTSAVAQGAHNQVTLINRADPSSVPSGTDSIFYGKEATDGTNELWFWNGSAARQVDWRLRQDTSTGVTVSSSSSYTTIFTPPNNSIGEIYMWATSGYMQRGSFVKVGSNCYGWAMPNFESGSGSTAGTYLKFANVSGGDSTLKARKQSGATTRTWLYKVYYRLI